VFTDIVSDMAHTIVRFQALVDAMFRCPRNECQVSFSDRPSKISRRGRSEKAGHVLFFPS